MVFDFLNVKGMLDWPASQIECKPSKRVGPFPRQDVELTAKGGSLEALADDAFLRR
jgi:hypothetical protein